MHNDLNSAYRVLSASELPDYLDSLPGVREVLGGTPSDWRVRDVADGNLNAVFLVDSPAGGLCVKQALPWVRVHGESWPLTAERALFEYSYMARLEPFVGCLAPKAYHFDPINYVIVMEKLEPHIILRKGLIAGQRFPLAARDTGAYIAAGAFHTSDLALPFERKFNDVALFARNQALLRITVDLVFTDPYVEVWRNRWTTPHLDQWTQFLRSDFAVKSAVADHRRNYLSNTQALIHGDLHTGSVMVTEDDTRVIDGEFASYGPIGFDLGAFLANMLVAWYAKAGHISEAAALHSYRQYLLDQIAVFWNAFHDRFLVLWESHELAGDAYPQSHFEGAPGAARLRKIRAAYLDQVFKDTIAFAAIKIIRRIVGYAQLADFEVIEDLALRAHAQAGALALAYSILTEPDRYTDIAALIDAVSRFEHAGLNPHALI
ncbi:S-methyl-5-thioribose kinase [Uliginosibacterium gangwonense]|uniref:S-methyl-5-thioribose kinase n=1 Tax=Uliginosibacterium gangwonense TaxID=392736 RepID=UPI00039A6B1B|nr:S-methyl-5-thioribose kinase [Uliginosibacterium gangwonense]